MAKGHWVKRLVTAAVFAAVISGAAHAIQPKQLTRGKMPKDGHGAVLMSVRSQMQVPGGMYFWFVREGGDPKNKNDVLMFYRGEGVPLIGETMYDTLPKVYSIPAGRYHLLAHVGQCRDIPPPDTVCNFGNRYHMAAYPTARYDYLPAPSFVVEPGKLTDAGEFILELPFGAPISKESPWSEVYALSLQMKVRWRPIEQAESLRQAYAALPSAGSVEATEMFRSYVNCQAPAKGQRTTLYVPFDCPPSANAESGETGATSTISSN